MNFFTKVIHHGEQVIEFEDLERLRKFKENLRFLLVYDPPNSLVVRKRILEHSNKIEEFISDRFTSFMLDNNRKFEPKISKHGTSSNT
jgi:hypothetical protein